MPDTGPGLAFGRGACLLYTSISQVESRLLGITGILDIANTKINGEAANCTLTLDHIPVLGTIEPGTIVISG